MASSDPWQQPSAGELLELDGLGVAGSWTVAGREVHLTNLDKVLAEARGVAVTKRDYVRYLTTMAPVIGRYLSGRPVNLTRFPDGVGAAGFWQKAVPAHAPSWLERWEDPNARPGRTRHYLVIDGVAALAWVANAAAVEIHPWTSTCRSPSEPSYALVDIDPGPATTWADTVVLARQFRAALDHLGLLARPKLTGKRGLQIWIPVRSGLSFGETQRFVERLSRAVGASVPDLVSWRWNTSEREGLARLDYTQNRPNATLIGPYSLRAVDGAPVSVPLEWHELDDPALRSDRWSLSDTPGRVAQVGDPFSVIVGVEQDLPKL